MPRVRRAIDSDDDSSKENQEVGSTVSNVKVKFEKSTMSVSNGEMDRTESRVKSDEDEDAGMNSDPGEDDEAEGSSNGKKRARINEDGHSVPVKKGKIIAPKRIILSRDKDG